MTDDFNNDELFEEFPELAESGVVLEKEVLAHFGLLFSTYADLEAGVQNCYIIWQLGMALSNGEINTQRDWVTMHDALEKKAFASTFGSLLQLVSGFDQLDPFMKKLEDLKKKRDYFAHHFFREENDKLFSNESILNLLFRMHRLRENVKAIAQIIDTIHVENLQVIYPSRDMKAEVIQEAKRLKGEYLENPPTIFGWEADKG